MMHECMYTGYIAIDNSVCNGCHLFLETCHPIVTSTDGFSAVSECGFYLCEGCNQDSCIYRKHINL